MKVKVNSEICIGCTLCTQVCSEVFKMDGDKAVAYTNPVPEALAESAKAAVDQCPVEAITLQ